MRYRTHAFSRRRFLQSTAFGAAFFTTPGLFAEQLERTPGMTEGPFFPDKLPLDTDNDLLIINDAITPGVGEVTHLTGRLLSPAGEPIPNALVEIWQCDANGAYLHSGTVNADKRDSNFQGYGRFLTNRKGEYYFRTIKPVPYPGRTPHIHFAVSKRNDRLLTTQMMIKGHPQNEEDFLVQRLTAEGRKAIEVPFQAIPDVDVPQLAAHFDLVLGLTPEEPEQRRGRPRNRDRRQEDSSRR
jgi:protocatechuate 3,4-dioxygenase, beta subunit